MHIQHYDIRIIDDLEKGQDRLLESALTRHFLNWWRSYAPKTPRFEDFDITDHLAIADNVFLVKVLDSNSFNIRLCAEVVSEVVGSNNMGVIISTDGPQSNGTEREYVRLAEYYKSIVETWKCCVCLGTLTTGGDLVKEFESVDCPLFDEDGAVNYIIGVLVPAPSYQECDPDLVSLHIL